MHVDDFFAELMTIYTEEFRDFGDIWQEHLDFWDGDERGRYNDISPFVHRLVEAYSNDIYYVRKKRSEAAENAAHRPFERVFSLVEKSLTDGDADTREIAMVGFLEDIQNVASHKHFGAKAFEGWLGPATRVAWDQLNALWEGKSSLMDVIRAEKKESGD